MGNAYIIVCAIICFFSSLLEAKGEVAVIEDKKDVLFPSNIERKKVNDYILRCKQFELKNNTVLQEELNQNIREYFERQTECFIDEEFGIISSYGHILDAIFKSELKNKEQFYRLYQLYYKTTELHTLLRDRLVHHQRGVEEQRRNLLKGMVNLRLLESVEEISIKLETIEISSAAPLKRAEAELGDEVFSLLLDKVPLVISLILSILGIFSAPFTKGVSIFVTILSFGYMTYKGITYDNQVRKELAEQCEVYINNNKIDVLEQLNHETEAFYKFLQN